MKPDITDKEFEKMRKEHGNALAVRITKEEDGILYILIPVQGGYNWQLPTAVQLKNINKDNERKGGKIYTQQQTCVHCGSTYTAGEDCYTCLMRWSNAISH